jgi:hypothetical protein
MERVSFSFDHCAEHPSLTATRFLQPIQLPKTWLAFLPVSQLLHPPSTMPFSNNGPTKRRAVRAIDLAMSMNPIGHQPRIRSASVGLASPYLVTTYKVIEVLKMHEKVTARIRARITVGESRESWGEGRVVAERYSGIT